MDLRRIYSKMKVPMRSKRLLEPSIFVSGLSLAFLTVSLAVLISWNESSHRLKLGNQKWQNTAEATASSARILLEEDVRGDALDITDDTTKSATCKQYLYNFLNGTTDVHDECQAFKNAFNAADCLDDAKTDSYFEKRNRSGEDDLYIDDFFENWEVRSR